MKKESIENLKNTDLLKMAADKPELLRKVAARAQKPATPQEQEAMLHALSVLGPMVADAIPNANIDADDLAYLEGLKKSTEIGHQAFASVYSLVKDMDQDHLAYTDRVLEQYQKAEEIVKNRRDHVPMPQVPMPPVPETGAPLDPMSAIANLDTELDQLKAEMVKRGMDPDKGDPAIN